MYRYSFLHHLLYIKLLSTLCLYIIHNKLPQYEEEFIIQKHFTKIKSVYLIVPNCINYLKYNHCVQTDFNIIDFTLN